ncbi:MAG: hypothetical protein GF329_02550 [Candidatus Lokiarchaeota archaeon]|nr:hypothetical protein [Candidatus Lokiarchaeota archaeon]
MDPFSILNLIFSIIGMCIFVYCIFVIRKILKLFPKAKMRKDWIINIILILIFTVGYGVNIIAVIFAIDILLIIMQAFVYLFGAIFVFIVIRLSYKTYKLIIESAKE